MGRRGRRGLALPLACAAIAVLGADSARAATLRTIETPSRHVDPADVEFNGADHPGRLRARILLPEGYDGKRRFRVLFLLHGVGDSFATWSRPERGNVAEIAKDLGAVVVMPEAARGFYTNWWNGGRRGEPGWERFYLDELIPLIERRFQIKRGRRWHAVAGLSMGGMGATFLASQLPSYFGSAATFSGFVQHQRPEIGPGIELVTGQSYEAIFGPMDGFYATGHNPTRLTDNLRHTRLYVTVGNGVAEPGIESSAGAVAVGGLTELELRLQAEELVAASRQSGVEVTYEPEAGVHDWPYWRRHLAEAIEWGFYKRVRPSPRRWTYRTVARRGSAWGFRYRFEAPPSETIELRRERRRLSATGSGRIRIRNGSGCGFTAQLPFERRIPPERCRRSRGR